MRLPLTSTLFPKPIWAIGTLYFIASLVHFAHNAEYIAYYPNMPAFLTRETVYLSWLAVTAVGALGVGLSRFGWRSMGALLLAVYGALGLGGLAHYSLALCAEHTVATNLTIWFEVVSGVALAVLSGVFLCRPAMTIRSRTRLRR